MHNTTVLCATGTWLPRPTRGPRHGPLSAVGHGVVESRSSEQLSRGPWPALWPAVPVGSGTAGGAESRRAEQLRCDPLTYGLQSQLGLLPAKLSRAYDRSLILRGRGNTASSPYGSSSISGMIDLYALIVLPTWLLMSCIQRR
jgi:hypothetical protein